MDAKRATDCSDWPAPVVANLLGLVVDLSCRAGFDGYFKEVSPGWEEMLGFPTEVLLSRPYLDFVHADDVEDTKVRLAEGRHSGEITRFECRFIGSDGVSHPLMWTAIASSDDQCYRAVAIDLTREREAEELVRESERRYADLIESSHDIVQSIDPTGHFQFVNRAWHDHLGYSVDELADLTLFDIVAEADHEHCSLLIGRIMSGESFENIEVTFVARDGHSFPVEGNATGRFRDGEFVATHTFFRDISERRKAEELSAQYQHQLEEDVAERTAALVQSEKLATLGRLSAGMAHELNNPAAAAQRGSVLLRDALGAIYQTFLALGRLGLSESSAARLGELIDASAATATQPDTIDPISRSDREADVEDWLDRRGIADAWQLAGPIVGLQLCADDLESLAAAFSPAQLPLVLALMTNSHTAFELAEQIGHGTLRISEIVTALKGYSFMDRAPVQDIDIHEGLDNTIIMLQAKLKQGVEVVRDYGPEVPRIEALGSELNQVWTNLIDNAVDAMDGTGRLEIRTRRAEGSVVVEIEDDGPGIAPESIEKVFDPFFTTKLPGQGTGLGLNIVFNIVRGFGGNIEVSSEPGRTTFRVEIPDHLKVEP